MEAIGAAGLAALQRARVAVVGTGNVGGQAATHLAMLGVSLVLVDRDRVAEENLATQGFTEADLGLPKVEARARQLGALNPSCGIETIHGDVARLGLGRLAGVDLVLAAPDSIATRLVVNEVAFRLGIPWIDGAVDGSGATFTARVASFAGTPDAACYACTYDHALLARVTRDGSSRGCPTWSWGAEGPASEPTLSISAVGAAAAATQVIWGLQILLGRSAEVTGREIFLDLAAGRSALYELTSNSRCVFDHRPWALTPLERKPDDLTVEDMFTQAEKHLGGNVTLGVNRAPLVTALRCPACPRVRYPCRLLDAMSVEDGACACGSRMEPPALGLVERFGRGGAALFVERTWAELGLPQGDVVTAASGDAEVHFLFA